MIQLLDDVRIQISRDALVNSRRIKKTVADYPCAALERRFNHFAHQLTATGGKQEQLGFSRHRGVVWRELQKFPDRFADRRASRLSGQQKGHADFLKTRGQAPGLSGFPAPFRAFERDKRRARHQTRL